MDLSSFDFLPLGEDTEILPFDCNDADLNNFLPYLKWNLNGMGNYIGAVSLNPYTEQNYRFVLHELGHLLGLEDVEDLSNLGLKNKASFIRVRLSRF